MNSPTVLTLSQIPNNADIAREILAKIETKEILPHPSFIEDIMKRLRGIVEGTYKETEAIDIDAALESEKRVLLWPTIKEISAQQLESPLTEFFIKHSEIPVKVSIREIAQRALQGGRSGEITLCFSVEPAETERSVPF